MTPKVKPELLMVGSDQFPRCVILDGNAADLPRFWTGNDWTTELRRAMLFADDVALKRELTAIASRS